MNRRSGTARTRWRSTARGARIGWLVAVGVTAAASVTVGASATGSPEVRAAGTALRRMTAVKVTAAAGSAYVRVNQVGYGTGAPKRALLMARGPELGATFQVLNRSGVAVLAGPVSDRVGGWSRAYPDVYALELTRLTTPGLYTIRVRGPRPARSPAFRILGGEALYRPLLGNALRFFEAQRDGPRVVTSVLGRRPSHLHDRRAGIYRRPSDSNVIGTLRRIGGPVDVSGGWFDAGDYLKFVETASYADAVTLLGVRQYPSLLGAGSAASSFSAEARFGLDWLRRMWSDTSRTLLYQVGVGDGQGRRLGDHDLWRLPQIDDRLTHPSERYEAERPALRAGPAGARISPNLAGRLAADFALCFQIYRRSSPAYAATCLRDAEHIFALADTRPRTLTTASPYSYYPETQWRDDMELGATELYLALAAGRRPAGLPHAAPRFYLAQAAHWARSYLLDANRSGYDSLNLYDVSGLAHYELYRAIARAGTASGLEVTQANLLDDCTSVTGARTGCGTLQDQLGQADTAARTDPFGLGFVYSQGDVVPHALGVAFEAGLYDALTGESRFAGLAQHQLDFVLGANAWGSSFVVGAGTTFPHCLQHQVANLVGGLNGRGPLLLGATVDGPNADTSAGLPGGAPGATVPRPCTVGGFGAFNARSVVYRDGAADFPNTEPADDYTAQTVLAFAQAAR